MQRLWGLSILLLFLSIPASAQDVPVTSQNPNTTKPTATAAPQDETPPPVRKSSNTEISGGFTVHRYYQYVSPTQSLVMPGGYVDIEHNIISRWLGAELQVAAAYKDQGAPGKLGIYTIMAGPTFYPLGHRKVTFFGHVLAGAGFSRDSIAASIGFPSEVLTHTSKAWAGGAGLDLDVSRSLSVRVGQLDYVLTNFTKGTTHDHDVRISFGFVYHFGRK